MIRVVRTCLASAIVGLGLMAVPALAQDATATFSIAGGVIIPAGDVSDRFDPGFTLPIAVTFNLNERVGVQAEYAYSWMGGPETTITPIGGSPTLLESNHSIHNLNGNVVFNAGGSGAVGGRLIAGLGWYHRSVELTTPAVGLVSVCDPYWYVCYPVPVPVDQIVGERSSDDFGINLGGGATFGRHFFVDARFHYVWGPEIDVPAFAGGGTVKANGYYFPITFGVKF